VSFAAIILCADSQRVFVVIYFVMTQSGNFWIHPRIALADWFGRADNVLAGYEQVADVLHLEMNVLVEKFL
jgi:hypothetical protein